VLLFAAVAKLFGTGRAGANVLWALNLGFLALHLALLPLLSDRLGLGVLPGLLAAVLAVLIQPFRILIEWESILTGALLVVLCIFTLECFRAARDWRHAASLGFVWGVAILVNPQCVLLLLVWPLIAAGGSSREQWRKARRVILVALAVAAVTCLPWFVRNYQRFQAVFFIRDNFGLELYVSNNRCAQPTTFANQASGCHKRTHPNPNPEIAGEIIDKGEVQFNQERLRQALGWIESNPRAFARLTAQRFVRYWFPYLASYRYGIPAGIATLFSFAGLPLMYRKQRSAFWMLSSTLLVYPLVHYVVQFEARYRYPIFWATFVPAAYAILDIIRWLQRVKEPHFEPSALQHVRGAAACSTEATE
jgi:4-amino-4-deoxy-L-arabinose transferase-like glycosyltransferase